MGKRTAVGKFGKKDSFLKHEDLYLEIAKTVAERSKAKRKKVGAVLVKDNNIISFGWNGTPSGFVNDCEYEKDGELHTHKSVVHAEANAISKAAKSTISTDGSTLFLTLSPCYECSKLLIQSGIKKVVYLEEYRDTEAINFLKNAGITLEKVTAEKV